ncbi:triosephosphate isomerase [candidate division WWE3 bacterium]|uniref:Triosephosphate isomerase n=1 Tax=candidate division WWE3 bacterium TaxID=2053526 RepID=A0A7X9DKT0_UNCKA|nr:triosephosphate isomerase [candidate division WWE3 bacterium]
MEYIIANWKMNMDSQKIKAWFDVFNKADSAIFTDKTIVIAPSFPYLEETKEFIKTPNTFLGAQDVDLFEKGAHTGATGVFQIKEFCKYIIVGHSERKETAEITLKKRDLCLENQIVPIVCFIEAHEATNMAVGNSIIVWEDPQNISVNGVYRAKNSAEIDETINKIKKNIPEHTLLVYGGSVNRDNIGDLAKNSNINGVLIGNASLDPQHFLYIIENA